SVIRCKCEESSLLSYDIMVDHCEESLRLSYDKAFERIANLL
ncbi:45105_t:CDS:1, partial [Gigaspora margarita]